MSCVPCSWRSSSSRSHCFRYSSHLDCHMASFLSSTFFSCQASLQATPQALCFCAPSCSPCPVKPLCLQTPVQMPAWPGHPAPLTVPLGPKRAPSAWLQAFPSNSLACSGLSSPTLQPTLPPPSSLPLKSHLKYSLHPETFPSKLPAGCALSLL